MSSRFDRQLPVVGADGTERLRRTTVGIIGCGGLGTTAATALAAAGIGRLVLVDGDVPSPSDLNRQFAYREGDALPKARLLSEWVTSVNPGTSAEAHAVMLDEGNLGILAPCGILVDCLDNMRSRKLLNRHAVAAGLPLVHAGVTGMHGQVTVVLPGRTPCLECLLGDTDRDGGAIAPAVMAVAAVQAAEAVKLATGTGEPLAGRILTVDAGSGSYEVTAVRRDPSCPVCGHLPAPPPVRY